MLEAYNTLALHCKNK